MGWEIKIDWQFYILNSPCFTFGIHTLYTSTGTVVYSKLECSNIFLPKSHHKIRHLMGVYIIISFELKFNCMAIFMVTVKLKPS